MPTELTIDAPCKINLYLKVGERRADGFHSIESLFAAVNLCDTLDFGFSRGAGTAAGDEVYVETADLPPPFVKALEAPGLPPEKNLVYRAIKLFKRETGFDRAVRARVYKRIPPAAGLGGASSDAAAALLAMNTLSGGELPTRRLLDIAAELGSDVPFFACLAGGESARRSGLPYPAAFVHGRGELVKALALPPLNIVIVNPGIESGTKEAFTLLDAYRLRARTGVRNTLPAQKTYSKEDLPVELTKNPAEWRFTNDFLPVFLETEPVNRIYDSVLRDIKRCGALFHGLSGSGASCFGVFTDSHGADDAAARLSVRWPFVRSLSTKAES
ncbi:MAG: 4-(cytidine 5'-diphospho)-2-C-methyl-D-erythritol kinase [Spirochaetaceae bacterium]|jgi:4-diphosphocytidyl-2-C-methyl-D-erythritol kinase|nr:4-(cytidine 5'-diphospho)-2-C-methyl-D-erythritol kinase [Spirochaetaceae bacterium]